MRLKVFMSAGGVAIRASQLSSVKIHEIAERAKSVNPRRPDAATGPHKILYDHCVYITYIYIYIHLTPCQLINHNMTRTESSLSSQVPTADTVSGYATSSSQTCLSPPPSPCRPPHPSPQLSHRPCKTPYTAAAHFSPQRLLCQTRL